MTRIAPSKGGGGCACVRGILHGSPSSAAAPKKSPALLVLLYRRFSSLVLYAVLASYLPLALYVALLPASSSFSSSSSSPAEASVENGVPPAGVGAPPPPPARRGAEPPDRGGSISGGAVAAAGGGPPPPRGALTAAEAAFAQAAERRRREEVGRHGGGGAGGVAHDGWGAGGDDVLRSEDGDGEGDAADNDFEWRGGNGGQGQGAAAARLVPVRKGRVVQATNTNVHQTMGRRKRWRRTKHTLGDFTVAGVNLAEYGLGAVEKGTNGDGRVATSYNLGNHPPFELFSDFNIGEYIDEDLYQGWWDLQRIKQLQKAKSLSFYVDKVAQKRWLPTQGYEIPEPYALRYALELSPYGARPARKRGDVPGQERQYKDAIEALLPAGRSYCAKPSHLSLAQGVWLVNEGGDAEEGQDYDGNHRYGGALVGEGLGRGMEKMTKVEGEVDQSKIASGLARDLYKKDPTEEVAQLRVQPGIVIEERYTMRHGQGHKENDFFDRDDLPAMEFKIFVIWGRVFVVHGRRGVKTIGWMDRDGVQVLLEPGMKKRKKSIGRVPEWVDWSKLIRMAEGRAAHMDMMRVDIFVGMPSSSNEAAKALREDATGEERRNAYRYVLSEVEMQTTSKMGEELEEEATRLWIAGYKMGNFKLVPNTEVPKEFLEKGYLPMTWSPTTSEGKVARSLRG